MTSRRGFIPRMKRLALLTLTAASAAAIFATSLFAAENDAPQPAPSPAAETPAKKEGREMKKHDRRDRGEFRRGPGESGPRRGPEGFHRRGGPGEGMGLMHMLNLSDDQKARVKEIMEANRPKIEAIRKEEMARIKAVMEESMKQIEPLLTPDQKQVLADMEKLRASREKLMQDKTKPGE